MGGSGRAMSYDILADYYDRLVKDEDATRQWCEYTYRNAHGTKVLELACGSGEITLALSQAGYQVDALDLSKQMIEKAKAKDTLNQIGFFVGDMRNLDTFKTYETILCYCDSINYLEDPDDFKRFVHEVSRHLQINGRFLFDMHTEGRLVEFQDPFIEEGWIDTTAYQWVIESEGNLIIHHFHFYFEDKQEALETHIQHVFTLIDVMDILHEAGFVTEISSDFNEGIDPNAEKYFITATKEKEL